MSKTAAKCVRAGCEVSKEQDGYYDGSDIVDTDPFDYRMEESKEDEEIGNNYEGEEVTKVANPFAMKSQRLHPRWPSVAACALRSHTTKTPRDSLCSVGCCCRVSVRRQPAQGQYKSQEGHHRRQDEREGRARRGPRRSTAAATPPSTRSRSSTRDRRSKYGW